MGRFKGTPAEYRKLHRWVERQLGTPTCCSKCGEDYEFGKYHWANISGEYHQNTDDWIRLCPRCHHRMDSPYTDKSIT